MKSETRFIKQGSTGEKVVAGLNVNSVRGYRIVELDFAVVGVTTFEEMKQVITYLESALYALPHEKKRHDRLPEEERLLLMTKKLLNDKT